MIRRPDQFEKCRVFECYENVVREGGMGQQADRGVALYDKMPRARKYGFSSSQPSGVTAR